LALFDELKRRNVFKVGIAYIVMAWLVLQVTDVILNNVEAPDWVFHVILLLLGIGLLFAVFFAWVYELTPEGIKKEKDVDRTQSITRVTGRKLDYLIIAAMAVALAYFAIDKFMLQPSLDVESVMQATEDTSEQAAAEPGAAAQPENSIAVLPFVNMSDDPGNEYFSDGISEELLNLLAKIPELHVAARTSSFSFKGQNLEIPEIAKRLNVAHVLEGSVRKAGDRVRITAQLTKADDGYHLWSETFDRTLEDIFAIQDEIAAAVVDALKVTLLGQAPRAQQIDPEAYALYLQATHLQKSGTNESSAQANALLKRVLTMAPDYAAGWIWLSSNYMDQVQNVQMPRDEGLALAQEALDRALAIDPNMADAHASKGWRAMTFEGDLASAARHFERALSLEPTNLDFLRNSAAVLASLGRFEESSIVDEYVVENDPIRLANLNNLAMDYLCLGRSEEALSTVNTLLMLAPERAHTYLLKARALLLNGDNDAALEAIQKEPTEHHRLFGLVIVYHALGREAESDDALAGFIGTYAETRPYHIARALAVRGEADRAFEWLEKGAALDTSEATWNLHEPEFTNIHDDPRWLPFLESVGMSPEQLAAIEFEVTLPE
jgi:TolB-like protein/Flp pilus assembly protein TadD